MDNVSKTLYIPLYGKAYVSRKKLFLRDEKAEEIWEREAFSLKRKSRSKWLAYYMGIRAAVFDEWVKEKTQKEKDAVVLHIGCGLDSRALRVGDTNLFWYDVDFPEVIAERRRYFAENDSYRMLEADVREPSWIKSIPQNKKAIVVMEGIGMYLSPKELRSLLTALCEHFEELSLLMDCYSRFAAKMSKYKNPVADVGVTLLYGLDDPHSLEEGALTYLKQHDMTPKKHIDALRGTEKFIFKTLYAGAFARKLYRLFEYKK